MEGLLWLSRAGVGTIKPKLSCTRLFFLINVRGGGQKNTLPALQKNVFGLNLVALMQSVGTRKK